MSLFDALLVALGACVGGFVSGLAGFGTGITAIGIWLYAVSPTTASSLVLVCSVAAQIQTLPSIWRSVDARRVLPFIVPGLLGVPVGTALLATINARPLKLAIGVLLLVFSAQMLLSRPRPERGWGGRRADGAIGFGAGVIGGLVGLSGVLPTMWAAWRGWNKAHTRGLLQTFNVSILGTALIAHAAAGLLTRRRRSGGAGGPAGNDRRCMARRPRVCAAERSAISGDHSDAAVSIWGGLGVVELVSDHEGTLR